MLVNGAERGVVPEGRRYLGGVSLKTYGLRVLRVTLIHGNEVRMYLLMVLRAGRL